MPKKKSTKKAVRKTVWVLIQIGYQYNDEYYYQSAETNNEGMPVKVFFDKESAERVAKRLTHFPESEDGYENGTYSDYPKHFEVVEVEIGTDLVALTEQYNAELRRTRNSPLLQELTEKINKITSEMSAIDNE
jgi:hypothetical protein